jgi:hypothetical protein
MASRREIAKIVDGLLQGFGKEPTREIRLERTRFLLGDVEYNVERLSIMLFWWVRNISASYPCLIEREGPVPIMFDSAYSMGVRFPPYLAISQFERGPRSVYQAYNVLENFYGDKDLRIDGVKADDLQERFRELLTKFIGTRSGGEDEAPTPRTAAALGAASSGFIRQNPYLDLEVHTNETGLRIHYTPSYFVDWSNVFGSPTTPSAGWILPGRYKFGAMRSNSDFLLDPANFDIPPTTAAHLVLR